MLLWAYLGAVACMAALFVLAFYIDWRRQKRRRRRLGID